MAAAKKTKSPGRKEHKARIAKMHRKLEKAAIKAATAAVNEKKEKDEKRKADKKKEQKVTKVDKHNGKPEKKEGRKAKADQQEKTKSVKDKKEKKKDKKLSVDDLLAAAEETGESDAAMSEDDEPDEVEEPAKEPETSNRMSVEDFFKGGFKVSDSEDEENDDEDEEEDQNLIDDEAEEGTDEEGEEEEGAGVEPMDEDEEEEDDEEDENDSLDGFIVDDDEEIEEEASSDEDASQSSEAKQEKKGDEPAFLSDNEETPFLSDNEQDETDEEMKKDEEEDEEESTDQALKKETVLEWIKQVETKRSVRDMRKLIVGFKSAVTMTDEESKPDGLVYTITDSEVFNLVIVATMRNAPIIFSKILPTKKSPAMSSRWSMQKSMVKQYLTYLLQLLKSLTDSDMLYLAVKEAEKCSLYWACFDRMAKLYIKVLLDHWANAALSDHVRIQAFLALRSLSVTHVDTKRLQETHYLELCLKNIYLTFVRNCKDTTVHTLPAINMMRNLAVQLYSINPDISYQQAFVYIRQLAIHLRSAMQLKTKASYQPVYNWQYVHCIDYWSNMLANCCQDKDSPLRPLIYPLTQVALGAVKLIPTAQYFPLRFHILKSVTSLGKATDVYIPLAPYLFELFESPELLHQAKPSTLKPLDWDVHLRAPKQYLHGRVYQDGVFEQLEAACLNYFKSYYHHIAFPEMAIPAISTIKRFVKKSKCKNPKGIKRMKDLAKKLELKANFVLTSRSKIEFSPADEAKVQEFIDAMRQKLQ